MDRYRLISALFAVMLLVGGLACGSSAQVTDEESGVVGVSAPPAVAATNGAASSGNVTPPPRMDPAATPTAFALTPPPPRIVTATPVVETDEALETDTIDCGLFESAEDAQAYFLTEGGGPLEDPYSLDTNRDGIACNAVTDAGAEYRSWDFEDSDGPGSEGVVRVTEPPKAVVEPVVERKPLELWEVDWANMQAEGIVRIVKVGDGLTGQDLNYPYDKCGTEVGTEPSEANRMFNPSLRAGWLWVDVPESDGDYCVGGYWGYETEIFPMPIYPPRRGREQRLNISSMDQHLVFRVNYEWRNHDVPPDGRPYGAVRYSQSAPEPIPSDDLDKPYETVEVGGEERPLACGPEMLPAAIWTYEEGFVPLTVEEEQVYAELQTEHAVLQGVEWGEDTIEAKSASEALGWYFVLAHEEGPSYCFNLANQTDLPDTIPCLECYERK